MLLLKVIARMSHHTSWKICGAFSASHSMRALHFLQKPVALPEELRTLALCAWTATEARTSLGLSMTVAYDAVMQTRMRCWILSGCTPSISRRSVHMCSIMACCIPCCKLLSRAAQSVTSARSTFDSTCVPLQSQFLIARASLFPLPNGAVMPMIVARKVMHLGASIGSEELHCTPRMLKPRSPRGPLSISKCCCMLTVRCNSMPSIGSNAQPDA